MILMIDNYDSFTYNLVQYLGELGEPITVKRNDKISLYDIEEHSPNYIIISPGPCTPNEAGISLEVIRHFSGKIPILGVCLGHQAIAQAFGGKVVKAKQLLHGKTSQVYHDQKTIYTQIPDPFLATRYHSLIVEKESLPDCLEITSWTVDDEIMGIRHTKWAVEGIQFHPESITTEAGKQLLANFLQTYRIGVV
ncbi:anthranilate synthase/aminodeoxychorismate synthase-like glutamine amidotransferase [Lederbergia galactosidilyticus]|uniref:aminodeoxychorismate/anthranilate synthase component II n=1 Tax=Lederbergia galactosidilytica TaxID=217031 RepID=UPI001AE88D3D|nr:aminodeoxychorismate/anthranilate synthase component II [Lederbergia galactosidilytica]MBP1917227.1 anthranilate synthase/aminodeoxychorismate synthase-like glutamine amidotransferase [Lederbergia galactosidilytica]